MCERPQITDLASVRPFRRNSSKSFAILVNEVQNHASGFFKKLLTPENRVLWREKLVQGLPDNILTALSAPNICLADLLTFWDPDQFQHGVYLKVAGDVDRMKLGDIGSEKLVYAGSATDLGKKPNGPYGMQVRRGEHEATFANPDSEIRFDKKARTLFGSASAKLSFGTLFTYIQGYGSRRREAVERHARYL